MISRACQIECPKEKKDSKEIWTSKAISPLERLLVEISSALLSGEAAPSCGSCTWDSMSVNQLRLFAGDGQNDVCGGNDHS